MPTITSTYVVDDPAPVYAAEYSEATDFGVVENGGLTPVSMWAKNTSNVGVPIVWSAPVVVDGSSTVEGAVTYKLWGADNQELDAPTSGQVLGPNERVSVVFKVRHATLGVGVGDEAGTVSWDVEVQLPA